MSILQKRSLVAGVLPTTASLLVGELGINVPDGRVFLRKSGSTDTIQSAITTGAQNSGSVVLSGSFTVSGSVSVFNNEFSVQSTGVNLGSITTDAHTVTGSFSVSGSVNIDGGTY